MLIIAHDGPPVNPSAYSLSDHVPPSLIGFWQNIVRLSRTRGYCWAKTATLASWWPSKRDGKETVAASTVWRWLRKLEAAGCVRIVPVPGSHERRVYPVFFRPRLKRNCTPVASKKTRSLLLSESPKGEETITNPQAEPNERTAEPLAEPAPVVVSPFERKEAEPNKAADALKADEQRAAVQAAVIVSLEKRNVSRTVAERVARLYPRERVKAAALAVDAYLKSRAGDVNRLIQTAARDGWTPNADTDTGLGQTAAQERARKIQYVRAPAGFGAMGEQVTRR